MSRLKEIIARRDLVATHPLGHAKAEAELRNHAVSDITWLIAEVERLDPNPADPRLLYVRCRICEACIKGEGSECHTPGCVMFLHSVDLPIMPELLEGVDDNSAKILFEMTEGGD